MSRSFHNVHVRSDDLAAIATRVGRWLDDHGYEAVGRARDADRIVRLGRPRRGWVSIHDDGDEAASMARALTEDSDRVALEVYCEASAVVWMALHRGGERVGAWGLTSDDEDADGETEDPGAPAAEHLSALQIEGLDGAELNAAWANAVRDVFPESAIAVVCKALGLEVATVFEERACRGRTLWVRRRTALWTPTPLDGPVCLDLQANAPSELFAGRPFAFQMSLQSRGGAAASVDLGFATGGDEPIVTLDRVTLRDGREVPLEGGRARLDVEIVAALAEAPDLLRLSRREAASARAQVAARTIYVMVHGRALRTGTATVEVTAADARAAVTLAVYPPPSRPLRALATWAGPEHDRRVFELHVSAWRSATLTFSATLARAWALARAKVIEAPDDPYGAWSLLVEGRVEARGRAASLACLDAIVAEGASPPWLTLQAPRATFGNLQPAPGRVFDGEVPALVLSLWAEPEDDGAARHFTAFLDETLRSGDGLTALVTCTERPIRDGRTTWEDLTLPPTHATSYRSWHAERLRGIDHEGVWLGPKHLARVDLGGLPAWSEVVELVGSDGHRAVRVRVPRERPRSDLRYLEVVFDSVMPSEEAARQWDASRLGQRR